MHVMRLRNIAWIMASALASLAAQSQEAASYENDFSKAELKSIPSEFLVLDGAFEVVEDSGNKLLELPGAPLDTFGFLFGPATKESATASARFFGTSQGRRAPTFTLGVNGIGGYKIRVAPAKKALELLRGDEVKSTVPLNWISGKWTHLHLAVSQSGGKSVVQGKCWLEGAEQPKEPTISWTDDQAPPSGRVLIQASPYSGTPIRFDDLKASGK